MPEDHLPLAGRSFNRDAMSVFVSDAVERYIVSPSDLSESSSFGIPPSTRASTAVFSARVASLKKTGKIPRSTATGK